MTFEGRFPARGVASGWPTPTSGIEVAFAGLDFHTQSVTAIEDSYTLTLDHLSGWWEPAPDATPSKSHGTGDGTVPGMLRSGARTIELRGRIIGGSQGDVLNAKSAIARARTGVIVVSEQAMTVAREATVRRVEVEFTDLAPHVSTYRLTLLADDPLRHGVGSMPLAPGAIFLPNRGDATAWPIFDLAGPQPERVIAHPGGTWWLSATPAGAFRVVDGREGVVWQNGTRMFQADQGVGPIVRPGGSSWTISGAGPMSGTIRRFEAWT